MKFLLALLLGAGVAVAGPLERADLTKIIREVHIHDPAAGIRPALLNQTIEKDLGVKTGLKSRAELLFQDATLTRLGAETFFSFRPGTRNLSVERGSILLHVPKGRGGARIHAAGLTAAITGTTIMVEHEPGVYFKVIVLEGSLRLSIDRRFGTAVTLKPGKMVLMPAGAKSIPDPVDIDLRKLVRTSPLVDPDAFRGDTKTKVEPLPSIALIDREIATQDKLKAENRLIATNLVILGNGREVAVASDSLLDGLEAGILPPIAEKTAPVSLSKQLPLIGLLPATREIAGDAGLQQAAALLHPITAPVVKTAAEVLTPVTGLLAGNAGAFAGTSSLLAAPIRTVSTTAGSVVTNAANVLSGTSSLLTGSTSSAATFVSATGSPLVNVIGSTGSSVLAVVSPILPAYSPFTPRPRRPTPPILLTLAPVVPSLEEVVETLPTVVAALPTVVETLPTVVETLPTVVATLPTVVAALPTVVVALPNVVADLPNVVADLPNVVADLPNVVADLPNVVADLPNAVADLPNVVADLPNVVAGLPSVVAALPTTVVATPLPRSHPSLPALPVLNPPDGGPVAQPIQIVSTSQVTALLSTATPSTDGTIRFTAAGGDLLLNGRTLRAPLGSGVDIRNTGGTVTLTNATLRGDVVKVGALGADGQLRIGGGSIDATSAIKLYAAGSNGEVRFVDNVRLTGLAAKTIAASRVTIDDGRTVTIGGLQKAQVFTDRANYTGSGGNGSTTGRFGGAGAQTRPHGQAPAF